MSFQANTWKVGREGVAVSRQAGRGNRCHSRPTLKKNEGIDSMSGERKQVAAQCRAVAHMATALASVYSYFAAGHDEGLFESDLKTHGQRTHKLMETLGDILNGMDATTEDDDWMTPVFDGARAMFPLPHATQDQGDNT